jgi:hypothetical protein
MTGPALGTGSNITRWVVAVRLALSVRTALCYAFFGGALTFAQSPAPDTPSETNEAGYVPLISGGVGYIYHVDGGVPTLEPQINPVLLVPFGSHVLLESRTDFTGFFQREDRTSGPYKGKVFTTVEYAQLDWLADTHATIVAGKYLLPFGLYNERLEPIWIRNLQDPPFTATIGTRTTGAGDGVMLRGTIAQTATVSAQYSAYFSALCNIEQLGSARTAGGDASLYFPRARVEIGGSGQRFLQDHHINSGASYISWQPGSTALDLKAEFDASYYGRGYWIESAYRLENAPLPSFLKKVQAVGRVEQVFPKNGGGNGLPTIRSERVDFGLNYYLRDDLRLLSSYARSFSASRDANVWNLGATYRFTIPLWWGKTK